MHNSIQRHSPKENSFLIPQSLPGCPGVVVVDTTWGEIQAMQVAEGVRTVDELEVSNFLEKGFQVIDCRTKDFYRECTIPGVKNLPHNEIEHRKNELDSTKAAIFFCNGPQCPQSPTAIRHLLGTGYPPERILYYRGGMHCWITMGLPVDKGK